MPQKRIINLIVGVLFSASAHSATVYVSDIQFIAIREGLNNSTRAVERGLKSGTPLEVIEQSDGYTKVRTPTGNEGWVADYFLSENTVTRDQLNALQTHINTATKNNSDISKSLKASEQKIQELNKLNSTLQDENNALQLQIENGIELSEKAQEIVIQHEDVSYTIESLKQQTSTALTQLKQLQDTTEQKWFMIGAATLFGGLLLGTLIPMIRRRKNGSWS